MKKEIIIPARKRRPYSAMVGEPVIQHRDIRLPHLILLTVLANILLPIFTT